MKDSIGQPLEKGDLIAYTPPYSSYLDIGTILLFTSKSLRVLPQSRAHLTDDKGILRDPDTVIKITQQYKHFTTEHPELIL